MLTNRTTLLFRFFIVVLLASSFSSCNKQKESTNIEVRKPNQFGLAVDDLIEVHDTIETGQTVSDLLSPHGVTQQKINEIEKKSFEVFHTKKFRADDEFYIYAKWDSVETVKYLVYVQDAANYVVFDLCDTINIYKKQKPVTIKEAVATGVITNSLYQTLEEMKIVPEVAIKLADVYAWQIDFFRLQQNDSFKVFYEQILVDDKPVGVGKILAASFTHRKENYYAFYFDKEKEGGYFDDKGNSLRRAFLKAPLKFSRITSRYSMRRFHPVLKMNKAHFGTDYAAPTGTPILTVGDGVVIETGYNGGNGNYVKVKHNATYTTQYLHMSRIAKGIRNGARVSQGQIIGYVGSTGLATGPHVCFRFWKNGKQVDPLREKYQSSAPINKKYKAEFDVVKKVWMEKLSTVNNQLTGVSNGNHKSKS